MIRTSIAVAVLMVASQSTAFAEIGKGRPASCLLVIKGEDMIRGECTFTPISSDGTFTISSYNGKYFAVVDIIRKGVAEGRWNEDSYTKRATTPLGVLYREEGCWVNDYASVCAY